MNDGYKTGNLSPDEARVVAIVRLNKAEKRREVQWEKRIGRLHIHYHWRSRKNLWGRFGGGWNWAFGFQSSSHCVIVNLLVFSLRFEVSKKEVAA